MSSLRLSSESDPDKQERDDYGRSMGPVRCMRTYAHTQTYVHAHLQVYAECLECLELQECGSEDAANEYCCRSVFLDSSPWHSAEMRSANKKVIICTMRAMD